MKCHVLKPFFKNLGFDNVKSFKIKAQWLKGNKLGGAMVWALDLDDFIASFCLRDISF
jgi:GH18 family chitinase